MENKNVLEKVLLLTQISKNYVDFLSQNSFDLENKILLYICTNKGCSPQDMIDFFKIKKTNLAIICKNLVDKNLIIKQKNTIDARSVNYECTKDGEQVFNLLLQHFAEKESEIDDKEKEKVEKEIDDIIKFLKI